MGRLNHEEKAARARQTLIDTIAKIDDLEPTLGGKWKRNMLLYYYHRLAELVLYQCGFSHPSEVAVNCVASGIEASLVEGCNIGK